MEIVFWIYIFIFKSLEYVNKDGVGRGLVNKFYFLLVFVRNRVIGSSFFREIRVRFVRFVN